MGTASRGSPGTLCKCHRSFRPSSCGLCCAEEPGQAGAGGPPACGQIAFQRQQPPPPAPPSQGLFCINSVTGEARRRRV